VRRCIRLRHRAHRRHLVTRPELDLAAIRCQLNDLVDWDEAAWHWCLPLAAGALCSGGWLHSRSTLGGIGLCDCACHAWNLGDAPAPEPEPTMLVRPPSPRASMPSPAS